ncbi:MAG: helix-turn-helix domain-containing protein [Acidobacteria bacterium]|nr:helix-turn-helix domain-containing protein [Acidobacteriota bacterium]
MTSTLRCFRLMESLAREPYELTLAEICAEHDLPKGSAHRLMSTLVESGFVEQDSGTKRYRLAGKALWMGGAYLRHSTLYRVAFPVVQDLSKRVDGMVHLGAWDHESVLYLHTVGPPSALYLFADTGERRPLHATGLGKAMLAFRPESDLESVFSRPVEAYTEKTITSIEAMREELERIRAEGYAFDDEEGVAGLRCVAAPIWDRSGAACGAISASAAAEEVVGARRAELGAIIREGALRVSVQMGFRPKTTNLASLLGKSR